MTRRILTGVAFLAVAAPLAAQELNEATEAAIKAAVQKVAPSVVQIETSGGTEIIGTTQVRKGVGPTTGVAVGPDGFIITSAFNFANKPSAVFVTVPGSNQRYVAKTVCTDQTRMLTLLKIEGATLAVPTFLPKKEFQIGQWAIALGRAMDPSLNKPPSVSVGIISALHRIWGKAVQTDAKVSPVNYGGPLIDVDGRVIGILIPASPFSDGDTAGVEWYDSGIGFAVPLEDVMAVLPRLKQGKDLRRGLLGVTPSSRDIYSAYSKIGTVSPDSAAAKAGIKPGDEIIEIDGKPVLNHAQVQHALGPKYEGDTVSVKVKRGSETKEFTNLVLSGSVTAYSLPFLGVLPMRDDPELGVEVRSVVPKSPADTAGIKPGDRLMTVGVTQTQPPRQAPFAGRDQFMSMIASLPPGTEIKLEVKRKAGGKTEPVTLRLAGFDSAVPETIPDESTAKKALEKVKTPAGPPVPIGPPMPPMPPPMPGDPKPPRPGPPGGPKLPKTDGKKPDEKKPDDKKPDANKPAEKGLLKRTNQARDHEYWVFVPDNYEHNVAHGLVIWLHAAGKGGKDAESVRDIWEEYCEKHHLILLGPKAESDTGWLPSESEFIAQTARDLMREYTIDRQRVVTHGTGPGGQMAFYLGFNARDLVRGVASSSAALATQPKDTLPNQRLQFFIVAGSKDPIAPQIKKAHENLGEKKFPSLFREIEMGREYLDRKTLEELVRWIDTLDRI